MRRLRFHLDENVNVAVADGRRHRGLDVTTPADAELLSSPDIDHLEYATQSGRILVTHDADFLRMNARGVEHAGIVYCAMASRSVGDMVRSFAIIAEVLSPEDLANRVEFI